MAITSHIYHNLLFHSIQIWLNNILSEAVFYIEESKNVSY